MEIQQQRRHYLKVQVRGASQYKVLQLSIVFTRTARGRQKEETFIRTVPVWGDVITLNSIFLGEIVNGQLRPYKGIREVVVTAKLSGNDMPEREIITTFEWVEVK